MWSIWYIWPIWSGLYGLYGVMKIHYSTTNSAPNSCKFINCRTT